MRHLAGVTTIGFDGDDTLWHNEGLFVAAQTEFCDVLSAYAPSAGLRDRLLEVEHRNLEVFGYGAKGFALSMMEAALELSEGRIQSDELNRLLGSIRRILAAPAALLSGVEDALGELAPHYHLLLITKGDLFEQEAKIGRSGLAESFDSVEIVSEKAPSDYARVLGRRSVAPEQFLMVGNSVRSDVLPVLELGGAAIHIPYEPAWKVEAAPEPSSNPRYLKLARISDVPSYMRAQRPPSASR